MAGTTKGSLVELTTSQVLNRAADLIEERGWGKGPLSMFGEVGLCVMGALYAAETGALASGSNDENAYDTAERCPAGQAVVAHLGDRLYPPDDPQMWRWNDLVASDGKQVIEVLRATALIEAAREEQDAAWETYAEAVTV
jgi:hypothetical protein